MKKLLIAIAAVSLVPTAAYAAAEMGMDCCKDCACCKGKKEGQEQPAPAPKPQ